VLAKVLSDHARARFGEFRDAILGMISAHSFDARVLRTANQLLAADMFRQVRARSLRERARARARLREILRARAGARSVRGKSA
jgi:hypothetical protein